MILIVGGNGSAPFGLQHLLAAHGLRADEVETACRILDLTHPDAAELLVSAVRTAVGARERFERLTAREREVLLLIVSGLLNKLVASKLGISEVTVEIHRSRAMQKMQAASFADLVRITSVISVTGRRRQLPIPPPNAMMATSTPNSQAMPPTTIQRGL